LEELDVRALEGTFEDPETEVRRLVGLRRDVGSLHRSLAAHREPFMALTHPEFDALTSEESGRRFNALVRRFDVTVQTGRDARESIVTSFDVLMARTEHETNKILKVLTLASVLFLPGALVAGILGMNFKVSLFEHPDLFWAAVAVIVAIMLGTATVARRRRWI
jgi:Mg2+ and Co2+ transporter CorA